MAPNRQLPVSTIAAVWMSPRRPSSPQRTVSRRPSVAKGGKFRPVPVSRRLGRELMRHLSRIRPDDAGRRPRGGQHPARLVHRPRSPPGWPS